MDEGIRRQYGPTFHASDVVITPPLVFLIVWGAVKLYDWVGAGDGGGDWRTEVSAGLCLAVLSLCALMDCAAPRSSRELKVMAVCALIYSIVIAWLITVTLPTEDIVFSWTVSWLLPALVIIATLIACVQTVARTERHLSSLSSSDAACSDSTVG
jgi:hypothetical protein